MHQDPDAAVRDGEAVPRRGRGPLATGLDEHGSVEVREGPGGGLDGKGDGGPGAVVQVPAAADVEEVAEADAAAGEAGGRVAVVVGGCRGDGRRRVGCGVVAEAGMAGRE